MLIPAKLASIACNVIWVLVVSRRAWNCRFEHFGCSWMLPCILAMVHIFSVIYWIWVCISWTIMYVIYCILPNAQIHRHNLGFACVWERTFTFVSFNTCFLRVFSTFFFSLRCHSYFQAFAWFPDQIPMRFYFSHFLVTVLCAKISFSINLSAIMVFVNRQTEAWQNVYVVLYQFLEPTNSQFTHILPEKCIRLDLGSDSGERNTHEKKNVVAPVTKTIYLTKPSVSNKHPQCKLK